MNEGAPPDVQMEQEVWVLTEEQQVWQVAVITKITSYAEKQNGFHVQIDGKLMK